MLFDYVIPTFANPDAESSHSIWKVVSRIMILGHLLDDLQASLTLLRLITEVHLRFHCAGSGA